MNRLVGIGLTLLACGPIDSALTQERGATGPPRGLAREGVDESGEQDADSLPGVRSLRARPGLDESGIQIGALSGVDDAGLGLLTAETGGFSRDVWDGSDRLVLDPREVAHEAGVVFAVVAV